ncbi:transcription factor CP2-like protein 1 [Paramisgurnus dabryanus]|uniref:transcription factor CP2-like protein 1 n=1 Tax=Paramisgurnus dabryanus TaxID=90735 RepID=UPI003CCF577E
MSSCTFLLKPKGADRRLKNDQEKIEKKCQPSYKTTVLTECFLWPEAPSINTTRNTPSPLYPSSPASYSFQEGNCSPDQQGELVLPSNFDHLLPSSSAYDKQQWLHRNRFSFFCRSFSGFLGSDLLKMSRDDFIQICGPADGIRLFNTIEGRCVQPRLTVYVSQLQNRYQSHAKGGADGVYHALYLEDLTVIELTEIANLYNVPSQQIHHLDFSVGI